MQNQITLAAEAAYTGVGLHSGQEVHMVLKPAPVDTGIVFVRTDIPDRPEIHAAAENVTSTLRATTVEENGCRVFTIEHLMSAFHALGVDNCLVEMDAEEPPVAEGNSLAFFELMQTAGFREQEKERHEIVIDQVYRIDDDKNERFVMVLPYDGFRVSFTSLNPHKLIRFNMRISILMPKPIIGRLRRPVRLLTKKRLLLCSRWALALAERWKALSSITMKAG